MQFRRDSFLARLFKTQPHFIGQNHCLLQNKYSRLMSNLSAMQPHTLRFYAPLYDFIESKQLQFYSATDLY